MPVVPMMFLLVPILAHADPSSERGLRCATFPASLEPAVEIDTDDRTTQIGQWVEARKQEGRSVISIDFEIGSKATGFPAAWAMVCVR